MGSHCAEVVSAAIAEDVAYDELFCRTVEQRMWAFAEPVVNWTNAFLRPPPDHVVELIVTAALEKPVADALVGNFDDPPAMWRSLASPQRTAAFIERARSGER